MAIVGGIRGSLHTTYSYRPKPHYIPVSVQIQGKHLQKRIRLTKKSVTAKVKTAHLKRITKITNTKVAKNK